MTSTILLTIALLLLAFVGVPLLKPRLRWEEEAPDPEVLRAEADKESALRAIKDIEAELAQGKLTERDFQELRGQYLLAAVAAAKRLKEAEEGARGKPAGEPRRAARDALLEDLERQIRQAKEKGAG